MTVLNVHAETLKPEWCDYYGHLNEGYYVVAFSDATFAVQEHFGLGREYFETRGGSLYTVESHIRYLQEVRGDSKMIFDSMVFGVDAKRLRLAHVLKVDGIERATFECILLHFDTGAGRVAEMPADIVARLKEAELAELPDWAGRGLKDIR